MILHVCVANKIATYQKRDGCIVCGNSDYQIKFTFDSEWDAHTDKIARFIWNGEFTDVEFSGDTCDVPIIQNANEVKIGVYAGELKTTTSAVIGCYLSVLCDAVTPSVENDKRYANEAKEYAEKAEEAANRVEEALERAEETGVAGRTPVKGRDYWTDEDQESMIQQVIVALGTPVFGRVDENNNIILSGDLANGIYMIKYEDAAGGGTDVGTLSIMPHINQIPVSTDTDGSIYNGKGYKEKTRGNSSGEPASLVNADAPNPVFFTGFIPCKQGDIIRLKNCYIYATDSDESSGTAVYGESAYGLRSGLYDSNKTKIAVESWGNLNGLEEANFQDKFSNYTRVKVSANPYIDTDGSAHNAGVITQFTIAYAGTAFVRLCLAPDKANGFTPADAIVTVNQEIE